MMNCEECDEICGSMREYLQHKENHCKKKTCMICSKVVKDMRSHIRKSHSIKSNTLKSHISKALCEVGKTVMRCLTMVDFIIIVPTIVQNRLHLTLGSAPALHHKCPVGLQPRDLNPRDRSNIKVISI